jgi:hypothetical protein
MEKQATVVASFAVDRRLKRQLEKLAAAAGSNPSALLRFFLAKRCNAPDAKLRQ